MTARGVTCSRCGRHREDPRTLIRGDVAIQKNEGRVTFPWIATPPKPVERRASLDGLRRLAMTGKALARPRRLSPGPTRRQRKEREARAADRFAVRS